MIEKMKIKELGEKLRELHTRVYRVNQRMGRELKNIIKEVGCLNVAYEELNDEEKWEWKKTFSFLCEVLYWFKIFPFTAYYHWFSIVENLEDQLLIDLDDESDEDNKAEEEIQKVVKLGRKFEFEIQKIMWNFMVKYFEREERSKK